MRAPRDLAAVTAGAVITINLVIEHMLMTRHYSGAILIPGLLEFRTVWNRGVSFSLFWQDTDTGGLLLSAFLIAIVLVLAVMAWRARDAISACGLGLIIGGALGNLYDRIAYHAVFDFLFLHLGNAALFVCNFSDIAITLGALFMIADSFREKTTPAAG